MTDVAYLCNNCGSVHEVESIRRNLILDLRTASSYDLSGHRGMLDPRTRFLRWRVTQGLARALWPKYSHYRCLAWGRRLVHGPSALISHPDAASTYDDADRSRSNRRALKGA